jgi:hypothetical protein
VGAGTAWGAAGRSGGGVGEGAIAAGDGMASNFSACETGLGLGFAPGLTRVFRRGLAGASPPGELAGFIWDFGGATAMFLFEM